MTHDPSFCTKVLKSNPHTKTTSFTNANYNEGLIELAQITMDLASSNVAGEKFKIHKLALSEKNPKLRFRIGLCDYAYTQALGTLREALNDLKQGDNRGVIMAAEAISLIELAQITIDLASSNAAGAKFKIHKLALSEKNPKLRFRIGLCDYAYTHALDALREALNDLNQGDYRGVIMAAEAISDDGFYCEDAFKRPPSFPSPFTNENNNTERYANIIIVLKSDPRTKTTSFTNANYNEGLIELAQITIDLASSNAAGAKFKIHKLALSEKNPKLRFRIGLCDYAYTHALDALREALNDLNQGDYRGYYYDRGN
ncbi:hypothetical protein DH2020_042891 [Rehmannia glutinosa]|uniref:Pectinesterase inhibitor domain-containing protein n=1 Tax=Rehmannia glutinosa TaxID=99300 RepID=A0ABR0ULN7_REHGL